MHAPGAVFHLTARTNNKEHWFDPEIRNFGVRAIADAVVRTDVDLIAYAIMVNHLHLIIRQGERPLWAFMQPICRRLALRVHRNYDRENHVFGNAFRERIIADPIHLRRAIDYVHYNPVGSNQCKTAHEWAWSSCGLYTGAARDHCPAHQPVIALALDVFATTEDLSLDALQRDYRQFAEHRQRCRELPDDVPWPNDPPAPVGDRRWVERFGTFTKEELVHKSDLRDIVREIIAELYPKLPLDLLRLRRGGAEFSEIRREVVRRAMPQGHRCSAIARYLNVSPSAISRMASAIFSRPALRQEGPPSA